MPLQLFSNPDAKNRPGYKSEIKLIRKIESFFNKRKNAVGKHGYVIYPEGLNFQLEIDFLLIDDELGINLFEVKGINIDQIQSIQDNSWKTKGFYKPKIKPVHQVDRSTSQILEILDNHLLSEFLPKVGVKGIIVLPNIHAVDWNNKGFYKYKHLPQIIFRNDLENENVFFDKLNKIHYKRPNNQILTYNDFKNFKKIFFGTKEIERDSPVPPEEEMLKNLTKEQKQIVHYDEDEMLIKGVAGSGKTHVLIANALLKSKTKFSILFITFNKALNNKIESDLKKYFEKSGENKKFKVSTFHSWAWNHYFNLVNAHGKALINEDKKRKILWNAILRIPGTKRIKRFNNQQKDNLNFILDEFDFIKGKNIFELERYAGADRTGRGEKRLTEDDKKFILSILEKYEEIKFEEDVYDFIDLGVELIKKSEEIEKYDYVYVDEAQDLHQVELQLLKKIARKGFYVAADDNQKIYKRYYRWKDIGVSFTGGRAKKLSKSIRNTCEIAKFADNIQNNKKIEEENIETQFNTDFRGEKPNIIEIDIIPKRHNNPVRYNEIAERVSNYLKNNPENTVGILINNRNDNSPKGNFILKKIREKNRDLGKNIIFTTHPKKINFDKQIIITTLYQSKGLEFDYVIIPNFEKDVLTSNLYKDEEYWENQKNLWYMGFTRARNKLDIFYLKENGINEIIEDVDRNTYNMIYKEEIVEN
ncbi:MAG: UvrD-helicase domain-containing protein [Methanobrevibacter sp.]|jgi:superfamily I DNA/RNA helicase|nr:UvrD-helicase domain-containing protein [Methanobrevibacter sp.]